MKHSKENTIYFTQHLKNASSVYILDTSQNKLPMNSIKNDAFYKNIYFVNQ